MQPSSSSAIRDEWSIIDSAFIIIEPLQAIYPTLQYTMEGYFRETGRWYGRSNFTDKAPGNGVEYSNMGSTRAAYIVLKISDRPYEEYCSINIFKPLGVSVLWNAYGPDAETVVAPYKDRKRQMRRISSLFPVGFVACSAEDLSKVIGIFIGDGSSCGVHILEPKSV